MDRQADDNELNRVADALAGQPDLLLAQRSALGSGRLLFCRDQRAYAQLVSRMITDSEDFLPLLERFYQARRDAWIG